MRSTVHYDTDICTHVPMYSVLYSMYNNAHIPSQVLKESLGYKDHQEDKELTVFKDLLVLLVLQE